MELFGANTAVLERVAKELGESPYRGKQLAEWIYKKQVTEFSVMSNLPDHFREELEATSSISRSKIILSRSSADETTKYLLELSDGQQIESVLIPSSDRVTVCVSTQVGCAVGCSFCATGTGGFVRNLTAGEIVDQVLTLESEGGRRVTNVVYMGMGEPLLNYDSVLQSVRLLNNEVGIAMRKITISTVGVTPRIRQLESENLQLTLAVSLHAPDNTLRRQLIPLAGRYSLHSLIIACREYAEGTGRRITYEYLLIDKVNDTDAHARELVSLLQGSLANVNLIPYNAVPGKGYRRPQQSRVNSFKAILERAGIETTQRMERGHTISAACGQLKAQTQGKKNRI